MEGCLGGVEGPLGVTEVPWGVVRSAWNPWRPQECPHGPAALPVPSPCPPRAPVTRVSPQWYKLDELFEQERNVRAAMTNRAGLLALMLHQTIQHDPLTTDLRSRR